MQHGNYTKHDKQRNGGNGNTRQNVEKYIQRIPPSTPYWGLLINVYEVHIIYNTFYEINAIS